MFVLSSLTPRTRQQSSWKAQTEAATLRVAHYAKYLKCSRVWGSDGHGQGAAGKGVLGYTWYAFQQHRLAVKTEDNEWPVGGPRQPQSHIDDYKDKCNIRIAGSWTLDSPQPI